MSRLRAAMRVPGSLSTHPFEVVLGGLFSFLGAALLVAPLAGWENVSLVQALPAPLWLSWGLALLLSGPAIVGGIFLDSVVGRALERAGLALAGSAWLAYAVMIDTLPDAAVTPAALGWGLAIACGARALTLWQVDRIVRRLSPLGDR